MTVDTETQPVGRVINYGTLDWRVDIEPPIAVEGESLVDGITLGHETYGGAKQALAQLAVQAGVNIDHSVYIQPPSVA
jgi:hypothetical protein